MKKIFETLSAFLAYRQKALAPRVLPLYAVVETSSVCNLKCRMCPHSIGAPFVKGIMTYDTFSIILKQLKSYVHTFDLFGRGEPLLNPNLDRMIRDTHAAGIKTRIHTNGTLLTPENSEAIIDAHLDIISFSLDCLDVEDYNKTRCNADYKKTIEAISSFLKTKKRLKTSYPYVIIQSIAENESSRENLQKRQYVLKQQWKDLPVNYYWIIDQHTFGGSISGTAVPSGNRRFSTCSFPWYSITVHSDGTIVPCCYDWYARYPLGNISSSDISDVWNCDKMRNLRAKILHESSYKTISICAQCDVPYRMTPFKFSIKNIKNIRNFLRLS